MTASTRPMLAFGAYYAAQFAFLGVQLPFFPGWLDARGYQASEIGFLIGGALACRLLFAPVLAYRAEGVRDPRSPLRLVSAALAVGAIFLLLPLPKTALSVCIVLTLFSFGLGVPLADASVLRADRAGELDYGRTRGIGSFAFILANLGGGAVIAAYGDGATVVWMAAMALCMVGVALVLPRPGRGALPKPSLAEAGQLFRSRSFLLMLAAAGLCQGSHAVYYAFSELHWSALGYSPTLIGVLWTVGVVFEIGVLVFGKAVLRRIDPALLIALGALSALVRWPLTGLSPPLPVLFVLQVLHAGTFTAAFLGTIEFVGRAVPDGYRATAMTLISTFGIGAVTGIATSVAGLLFDAQAPLPAYLLMGGMGAGGLLLALKLRSRWDGGTLGALAV
ncbi:MFS transporter [Parvularcula dongshanensis]|uniref:PPP family 3-phenylpropionic acid transporter n=1 Tax=Parvularcula dongshanensis TaxID=1173995 RepID=A0A840HYW7_9PROT|nr:MFS transporter [Parvularcula dongshanensis]MBB4657769.1 PPP family 3-phenylpropionic acid transporter [Parvularcula dongshanensis]